MKYVILFSIGFFAYVNFISRFYPVLTVISEILNMFRADPRCLTAKGIVDFNRELVLALVLYK